MILDLRTMYIAMGATCFIVAASLLTVQTRQSRRDGSLQWAIGWALYGGFLVLIGLRGIIGDFLSIVIANTFSTASYSLLYAAVRQFRGRSRNRGVLFVPVASTFVFFWYFSAYVDNLSYRIIFISLLSILQITAIVVALLRSVPVRESLSYRLTGFAFVLMALVMVNRLLEAFTLPFGQLSILHATAFRNAGNIATLVAAVLSSIGFVLMIRQRADEDLRKSEERYRSLFTGMTEGFALHEIVCDEKGRPCDYRFLEINPAFERLTGLERDNLIGKTVKEVLPGTEEYWIETYGKVALTGEPARLENFASELDRHYEVFAYSPSPRQFAAMFTDVTARKSAEIALQHSEQRWATTLSSIGDAVIATDGAGRIAFMNPVAEGLTNWKLPEAFMKPVTDVFNIINEQTRSAVESPVAKVLREGMVVGLANHTILVRKDGTEVPIDDSGAPIRDSDGNATGVVLVFRDISERKRAEEELVKTRTLAENRAIELQAIMEAVPALVFITHDPQGSYMTGNRATYDLLGVPLESNVSKTAPQEEQPAVCRLMKDGQEIPAGQLPVQQAAQGHEVRDYELDLVFTDGTTRTIFGNATPLKGLDGGTNGAVGVFIDITRRKEAEEALQRTLQRFYTVLSSMYGGLLLVTDEGRVEFANQALCDYFDLNDSPEDLVGLTASEVFAKIDEAYLHPDEAVTHVREIVDRGQPVKGEQVAMGGGRELLRDFIPLHIGGQSYGRLWCHTDITERKAMERELQKARDDLEQRVIERTEQLANSEKEFRLLAEAMPQIVWITRADGWNIYFNQQWVDYTGLTLEESYGHGWNKPFHPDDQKRAWDAWQNAVTNNGTYSLECRLRKADGTYHWWLIRGVPVIDEKGEIAKWFGTCTDIEEIKKTEEVVRLANAYNRSLIEASLDPLVTIDREGCISDANIATEEATGYSRDEMIGTDFSDYFTDPRKARVGYQMVFNDGFVRDYPLEIRRRNGGITTPVLYNASVYRDEGGQAIGVFAAARDMTESRLLETQLRQAQKMEALGTLSGGIAHDFNNMLAAIIGFSELLYGSVAKGSRDERHLKRIMEASIRGRELVKQLLTFSRKTEQEKEPLLLGGIVEETAKLLRATTPATIDIRVNSLSRSGMVLGDATQIQQVLMNLCVNAVHAMREKGGSLDIELSDFSVAESDGGPHGIEPGPYMKLVVRDTGTGIPVGIIDRIFDPFFTTKQLGEGTGLGLSVVQGIVKQSNGYIAVTSERGKGSAFTVYLPRIGSETHTDAVTDDEIPTGSERILFVDDEEALVEMGEDILAELGYDITSRTNGREALALLKEDPSRFDLVITDQTMPQMTGIELAKEVLALRADMPIIMCTGFSYVVDADKARAAGIRAFAMKPLTKREIAKTVRKVLDE